MLVLLQLLGQALACKDHGLGALDGYLCRAVGQGLPHRLLWGEPGVDGGLAEWQVAPHGSGGPGEQEGVEGLVWSPGHCWSPAGDLPLVDGNWSLGTEGSSLGGSLGGPLGGTNTGSGNVVGSNMMLWRRLPFGNYMLRSRVVRRSMVRGCVVLRLWRGVVWSGVVWSGVVS